MKQGEFIRLIIVLVLGALLMFFVQPWFYKSRLIALTDVDSIDGFVSNYYTPGAAIVFVVSAISAILWYVLASIAKPYKAEDVSKWSLGWWLIGLLPLFSIVAAIYFSISKGSEGAVLSSMFFFVLDALLIFWFTTAITTSGNLIHTPPGARLLRRLIDR